MVTRDLIASGTLNPLGGLNVRLSEACENYLLSRDVSPGGAGQISHRVNDFVNFFGGDPPLARLAVEDANRWLADLQTRELSPETIHGYRQALHAVWQWAYQAGETNTPPLRLRRIKRPPRRIHAYTAEELRALMEATAKLRGKVETTKIPLALWWKAYIAAAYSTALRRGALLALLREDVRPDGAVFINSPKTGKLAARRLCAVAVAGLEEIARLEPYRPQAFPVGKCHNQFYEVFNRLTELSGVGRGTSKWIRRSAISYAEAREVGAGKLLGGHSSDRVTERSYRDNTIAPPPIMEPPPIAWG